jgi:hypothetical protein
VSNPGAAAGMLQRTFPSLAVQSVCNPKTGQELKDAIEKHR